MTNFVSEQEFWNSIYQNKNTGWDLKSPTPVFQRFLKEKKIFYTGKLLILGSGYGYDAVEAAKAGYEVTAIDFSASAVNFAKKLAKGENVNVDFILNDFFKLEVEHSDGYNAVFDYVTYCAIYPARREEYAKLIKTLLKCRGLFIALWFPVEKRESGPPFRINLNETESFFSKFLKLKSSTIEADTIKPRKGREVLQIYEKER
jgi:SAM-dependent methyltransferase